SNYLRTAHLYRQLGRPDSVNQLLERMRALGPEGKSMLASTYQSEGRWDEAAAIYQDQAQRAGNHPSQSASSLQMLANLYQGQERYGEAASVLQQAISTLEAAGMRDAQVSSI